MLARSGFLHVENIFGRQRRHRASLGDRAGYSDRLLVGLPILKCIQSIRTSGQSACGTFGAQRINHHCDPFGNPILSLKFLKTGVFGKNLIFNTSITHQI